MANIQVKRRHSLAREELRSLGERLADKLSSKLGGECRWDGDDLYYEQSGATAHIQLRETTVTVTAKLGLLMSAFAGMVESEIRRVLDEQLG